MNEEPKAADIVPFEKLRQRQLNMASIKGQVPKPVPVLTKEWDEDAGRYVDTIQPGPLTRFFSQRDPGDEV